MKLVHISEKHCKMTDNRNIFSSLPIVYVLCNISFVLSTYFELHFHQIMFCTANLTENNADESETVVKVLRLNGGRNYLVG